MESQDIIHLLPEIFQQTATEKSPLTAYAAAMETMHADSETILRQIDAFFDPYRTKDRFIPFLLHWVDLDWILCSDDTREQIFPNHTIKTDNLRQLIAAAWFLSKWRGTGKGLILFLETATGVKGFTIDEDVKNKQGDTIPFHIRVNIPVKATTMRHIIERIIEKEKPAYVTHETSLIH